MRHAASVAAGVFLAGAWSWSTAVGDRPRAAPDRPPNPALVKRGEYLVNEVARCGDCHTPRDRRGRLDRSRHLQGAALWFTPRVRVGEWEGHAPDITRSGKAGKWSEARMIRLLSTGKGSDPPMPSYHLSEDDARAVAAYLRSLPGKKGGGRKEDGRERRRERERDD